MGMAAADTVCHTAAMALLMVGVLVEGMEHLTAVAMAWATATWEDMEVLCLADHLMVMVVVITVI